jgi:hypothetical protein
MWDPEEETEEGKTKTFSVEIKRDAQNCSIILTQ